MIRAQEVAISPIRMPDGSTEYWAYGEGWICSMSLSEFEIVMESPDARKAATFILNFMEEVSGCQL